MELDLATIASSKNAQIAVLGVVAWLLKSLISIASKTYITFLAIENRFAELSEEGKSILTENKETNNLLKQLLDKEPKV